MSPFTPEEEIAALRSKNEQLQERNARLTETLREARDQLVKFKPELDDIAKQAAIREAITRSVIAITRGLVGSDEDPAKNYHEGLLTEVFEAALHSYGYAVYAIPGEAVTE